MRSRLKVKRGKLSILGLNSNSKVSERPLLKTFHYLLHSVFNNEPCEACEATWLFLSLINELNHFSLLFSRCKNKSYTLTWRNLLLKMTNTQYLSPDSPAPFGADRAFARSALRLSCSNIHTVKALHRESTACCMSVCDLGHVVGTSSGLSSGSGGHDVT